MKFEFGPPSADTILRVFRNVNADKIEKVFIKKKKADYVNIDKKQVLFFLTFLLKNYYRGFYDICRKNS